MLEISIIYEDEDVLVINKPAGLMVHSDGRTKAPTPEGVGIPIPAVVGKKTLTDWLMEKYPELKNVGEPMLIKDQHQVKSNKVHKVKKKNDFQRSQPEADQPLAETFNFITILRPGIVHRLDKETSGVLVIAKNQETFLFLKKQFQERRIKKVYRAIVWGWVRQDEGVIDKAIGRSRRDFRLYSAQRGARGAMREAVTEYSVLRRFKIEDLKIKKYEPKFSYLEIRPRTGRTHQIRVHMKYLNHPILCDTLYALKWPCPLLGFSRMALHAFSIEFYLPDGSLKRVEVPLPTDFQQALKYIEKYKK